MNFLFYSISVCRDHSFRRNTRGQCGFFEISRNLFQVNKYFSDLGWKVLLIHKQDFFKTHHHSQINRLKLLAYTYSAGKTSISILHSISMGLHTISNFKKEENNN